jgi:hypothetical protein
MTWTRETGWAWGRMCNSHKWKVDAWTE